jgi:hypothetical protein
MFRIRACLLASLALAVFATAEARPPRLKKSCCVRDAVQNRVSLGTTGFASCSDWTSLYDVPAGRRLVVEWVAAVSEIPSAPADPVDVDIQTWDGTGFVVHPLVRLDNSVEKADSFFYTQRWSGEVLLYSEGGESLQVRMCPDAELEDEHVGAVTFSGYLVEVP